MKQFFPLFAFFSVLSAPMLHAATVTDMVGRTVTLPDHPKKVYAPAPYGSYMLYAMDPSLMAGLVFKIREANKPFLSPAVNNLPVIGSITGQGKTANLETLLNTAPDLILMWSSKKLLPTGNVRDKLAKLGVPYAYAATESLHDYPAAFRFVGKILDREARGNALADAAQEILDKVDRAIASVPKKERPRVYYAEGSDGLATECHDSIHVELLHIAGDLNIHRCHTSNHKGLEKISMEQVLIDDPDVIIAQEKEFVDNIYRTPAWQGIKAVREKRVYLIPRIPFNWFDRPPSFMRLLGLQWLTHTLYPAAYPLDIKAETKKFYRLFMGVDLDDKALQTILPPQS